MVLSGYIYMTKKEFSERFYLSITGKGDIAWQGKLEEINKLGIEEAAVFLTQFEPKEREVFYKFLLKSSIKKVPLVHLRDDAGKDEVEFFIKNFGTEHFNIHEVEFSILDKWEGYWDKIYLEMDYDGVIPKDVKVEKIAGFCVDLAHYKASVARGSGESYYIFSRKDKSKIGCNHLSGYSDIENCDVHRVDNEKSFDYLKTLPEYIFGDIIAFEIENSIKEQMEYRKYIVNLFE